MLGVAEWMLSWSKVSPFIHLRAVGLVDSHRGCYLSVLKVYTYLRLFGSCRLDEVESYVVDNNE